MKRFPLLLVSALVAASLICLFGCGPKAPVPVEQQASPGATSYGEGVYAIDFGTNVPNEVAKFRAEHPDLVITALYAGSEIVYGMTSRLMIVTESRDSLRAR